jgi:hypothetical protein
MTKIISIDFDGTICKKQKYGNGLIHEVPNPGAKKFLTKLKKEGYKIVVLTVRLNPIFGGDLNWKKWVITHWMNKYEIPFDEITNNKPDADCFIDDKGVRFIDWSKIETDFHQFLPNQSLQPHQV